MILHAKSRYNLAKCIKNRHLTMVRQQCGKDFLPPRCKEVVNDGKT